MTNIPTPTRTKEEAGEETHLVLGDSVADEEVANLAPFTSTTTTPATLTGEPDDESAQQQQAHSRSVFLLLLIMTGVACLFQDASEIALLSSLALPVGWLALGHHVKTATTTTVNNPTRRYVMLSALLIVLRAIPAMDYFYYDTTRLVAYLTASAIISIVYSIVAAMIWLQVTLWQRIEQLEHLTLHSESLQQPLSAPSVPPTRSRSWDNVSIIFALHTLAFPILVTALFQLLLRFSPIGGAGNLVMGLAQVVVVRQVASLVGEVGVLFWVTWTATWGTARMVDMTATTTTPCATRMQLLQQQRRRRRMDQVWLGVSTLLLVWGGIRENVGMGLYLQDIDEWPLVQDPPLRVSCLTRPLDSNRTTLLERTHQRMAAGDDLILWSESALKQPIVWDDLNWNAHVATSNPGTLVATTFFRNVTTGTNSKLYNTVSLWNAQGLVTSYDKNRPVPVVEYNVQGGKTPPNPVTVEWTPLLASSPTTTMYNTMETASSQRTTLQRRLAMAICFDLDFDYLARHARRADVLIGPSWYWASLGQPLWHHNAFRALENGVHLIKCSERGISGHMDPYGRTLTAIPSLENGVYLFQVPLSKGIATIYASFGFLFGWICVGLAPFVLMYARYYLRSTSTHTVQP